MHAALQEEVFSCKVLVCYESDIFPVSWLLLSFMILMVLPVIRQLQPLLSLRMVVKVCNYMQVKTNPFLSTAHHTERQGEADHLLSVFQENQQRYVREHWSLRCILLGHDEEDQNASRVANCCSKQLLTELSITQRSIPVHLPFHTISQ